MVNSRASGPKVLVFNLASSHCHAICQLGICLAPQNAASTALEEVALRNPGLENSRFLRDDPETGGKGDSVDCIGNEVDSM